MTPSSPDLNIIEHVWHCLDCMMHTWDSLPQNVEQLWVALQEEWARMNEGFIDDLYESIPRCVQAVYEANDGNTCHYSIVPSNGTAPRNGTEAFSRRYRYSLPRFFCIQQV
jgi:hypothetical protein